MPSTLRYYNRQIDDILGRWANVNLVRNRSTLVGVLSFDLSRDSFDAGQVPSPMSLQRFFIIILLGDVIQTHGILPNFGKPPPVFIYLWNALKPYLYSTITCEMNALIFGMAGMFTLSTISGSASFYRVLDCAFLYKLSVAASLHLIILTHINHPASSKDGIGFSAFIAMYLTNSPNNFISTILHFSRDNLQSSEFTLVNQCHKLNSEYRGKNILRNREAKSKFPKNMIFINEWERVEPANSNGPSSSKN